MYRFPESDRLSVISGQSHHTETTHVTRDYVSSDPEHPLNNDSTISRFLVSAPRRTTSSLTDATAIMSNPASSFSPAAMLAALDASQNGVIATSSTSVVPLVTPNRVPVVPVLPTSSTVTTSTGRQHSFTSNHSVATRNAVHRSTITISTPAALVDQSDTTSVQSLLSYSSRGSSQYLAVPMPHWSDVHSNSSVFN